MGIKYLAILIMLGAGTVSAGTLSSLQTPDNALAYPGFPSLHGCGADTFNANDTAHGFCYRSKSSACSGRGCQPVVNSEYYDVNWNTDGSVVSSTLCGALRHHNPQPNQWTYAFDINGALYTEANCHGFPFTSPDVVNVDGVNYYYFATSPSGLFELLRNSAGPFVYQF